MADDEERVPFTLYGIKDEVRATTETIDNLSRTIDYVHNMEGKTIVVKSRIDDEQQRGGPLGGWTSFQLEDPFVYYVGPYNGFEDSYLYKTRKECVNLIKDTYKNGDKIAWVDEYKGNPDWAGPNSLSQDTWISICGYLPMDKIFILAGMNRRLRQAIHGREVMLEGSNDWIWRNGLDWRAYMLNLAFKEIPPAFPHSLASKNGAAKLNKTTLVKWGHYNENTMRPRQSAPVQDDPREAQLGSIIGPGDEALIFVHVGSDAFVIPLSVTGYATPETVEVILKEHARFKKVSKEAYFEFEIGAPPKEEMMEMQDEQFEFMGLDKPDRLPDGSIAGHGCLPIHDRMIRWRPGVPISSFNAREHTRVNVRVFVRRYFKDSSSATHKATIIDRFTSETFCKHCYRQMVGGSGFNMATPKQWLELNPDLGPICIHCFTHMHSDDILYKTALPKGKRMPRKCPKCDSNLIYGRDDRVGNTNLGDRKMGLHDYYFCQECDDDQKLWCAFVRQPIVYEPVWKVWKAKVTGDDSYLPRSVKRAREDSKQRKIESLMKKIKKRKLENEKDEAMIRNLMGGGIDDDDDDVIFKKPELRIPEKRPRKATTGKKPYGAEKKARMSPASSRFVMLEKQEEDDDDEYDEVDLDEDSSSSDDNFVPFPARTESIVEFPFGNHCDFNF